MYIYIYIYVYTTSKQQHHTHTCYYYYVWWLVCLLLIVRLSLLLHLVSVRRFPSFRTQPLESLSRHQWKRHIWATQPLAKIFLAGILLWRPGVVVVLIHYTMIFTITSPLYSSSTYTVHLYIIGVLIQATRVRHSWDSLGVYIAGPLVTMCYRCLFYPLIYTSICIYIYIYTYTHKFSIKIWI